MMTKKNSTYKMKTINGDAFTPITIFKKLKGKNKFLLESSFQHETKGKYSYIGVNPYEEIIGIKDQTVIRYCETGTETTFEMDALTYLKTHFPKIDSPLPLPFSGGAIGFVGYDAYRQYADLGKDLPDELGIPDIHFMVYKDIIVYEHFNEKVHLITLNLQDSNDTDLTERLTNLSKQLERPVTLRQPEKINLDFKPQVSKERFIEQVEQAKASINSGETTQVVLSQKLTSELKEDPFSFYRHLRSSNPSPYMFYLDFTDYLIIGASPEALVQVTGNQVTTNPIAGTRPRGKNEKEDEALADELLADPKEINEHDMLVDLSKHDLTQICDKQSIHVPVYKQIEKYQHVMHIVSEVQGRLQKNKNSIDALIACMPAGTVSGAPKTRAMQIINEIETSKRGFYAGGLGYITYNHDINIAISIRSLVIKNQRAHLQTGAGIVKDSIPEKEYEETLHKARSLTDLTK
ncbi:MAG TPA: anthranilate synthase component I [Pseudogracilibacillus sp.]|nr:anthranilate synthase component I [Pseudogracilibacillus sp.]